MPIREFQIFFKMTPPIRELQISKNTLPPLKTLPRIAQFYKSKKYPYNG